MAKVIKSVKQIKINNAFQASREIAEKQRKAREEAENKRIEQIMTKVRRTISFRETFVFN